MSAADLLYDYFEDHVRACAHVNERPPLAFGLLCFAAGGLSLFVAQAVSHKMLLLSFGWTSCAVVLLWHVAAGFLLTAAVHLILSMGGARGSAAALFVLFGLAELAWALALPLALLLRLAARSAWLGTAAFLAVGFLSLSLKARSLQDNYGIGPGRAWFTLGLPYAAVAAGAGLLLSLAVVRVFVELAQASG